MNYDIDNRTVLEDEVLGYLICKDSMGLYSQQIIEQHGITEAEYFGNAFNKDVFRTMQKCWENNLPADFVNLINLRPDNYRDKENVLDKKMFDVNLTTMVQKGSVLNEVSFVKKVWLFKQYIIMDFWNKVANDIIFGQWDFRDELQVGQNIIDSYNLLLEKITKNFTKTESVVLKQREYFMKKMRGELVTVPSGVQPVDEFTGGWHNGELIVIAARPGAGKTTVALKMAIESAFKFKKKVLFSSFEMPKVQVMNKVAAYILELDYKKIKAYEYDYDTMQKVFQFYEYLESSESFLVITDQKEVSTISDIGSKLKEIKAELFFADYLQLIKIEKGVKIKAGNREQEIAYISGSLKAMAVEYDIPVIALSQLSRAVENRDNKRPKLSDLRESGSIEQDADIVMFLYRDAYYKEISGQPVLESERWDLEMNFAKGRDLGTRTLYLYANYITYEIRERTVPLPP